MVTIKLFYQSDGVVGECVFGAESAVGVSARYTDAGGGFALGAGDNYVFGGDSKE